MDLDFFEKHVPTLLFILFLSIATLFLTARLDQRVRSFKSFIFYIIMPVPQRLSQVIDYGQNIGENVYFLVKAHEENNALKKKIDAFTRREHMYFRLSAENERLRELVDFKNLHEPDALCAQIIGRDPLNWFQSFLINQGTEHGVYENAPVIAVQGDRSAVIGRIHHASKNISNVLLLTDSLSSVAVTSRRSGSDGIIEGDNTPQLGFNYIVPEADIVVGDTIVTSGLGEIFPPGLLVGHVKSIAADPEGYFKQALVVSAVDYNQLREVMILIKE